MSSYNEQKLAEAQKAFPNLAELREEFPRGRLADGNEKYMFIFFTSDDATLFYSIGEEQDCLWGANQEITYLEPPRDTETREFDGLGCYDTECNEGYRASSESDNYKYCPFCGKETQEQP